MKKESLVKMVYVYFVFFLVWMTAGCIKKEEINDFKEPNDTSEEVKDTIALLI